MIWNFIIMISIFLFSFLDLVLPYMFSRDLFSTDTLKFYFHSHSTQKTWDIIFSVVFVCFSIFEWRKLLRIETMTANCFWLWDYTLVRCWVDRKSFCRWKESKLGVSSVFGSLFTVWNDLMDSHLFWWWLNAIF